MEKEFFNGKTILVMGLGRFAGGVDSVKFAHQVCEKVIVTDLAEAEELEESLEQLKELDGIEYRLGEHNAEDFERADVIIVNPAVNPDNELIKNAKASGKIIMSQIGIFFELCSAKKIGITGANGKSTTTALTHHLLEAAVGGEGFGYRRVWLGGNIGNQPLLDRLDDIGADDLVVLELSSFQIEQLSWIGAAPEVALITNLAPNHLDRHLTFEAYSNTKEEIFKHQKLDQNNPAISIFNSEDTITARWYEKYKAETGRICICFSAEDVAEDFGSLFALPGRANLSNLAAAVAIAKRFGVNDETIKKALPGFKPLPHRLEFVARIDDVSWYNDSIATTPESTMAAIEAFKEPKILIAGGYDKNLPMEKLGRQIAQKAKACILIGQTAEKIAEAIGSGGKSKVYVEIVSSLAEAVKLASQQSQAGDVVLLSPACASYDMFDNFQQRGRLFCELVRLAD